MATSLAFSQATYLLDISIRLFLLYKVLKCRSSDALSVLLRISAVYVFSEHCVSR